LASWRQIDAESLRVKQSEQEVEAMRTDVAADVLERVLAVLDASEELTVVQAEKDAVRGQRTRLRRMVDRQMAKITDLLEVDAHYVTLEAREIEARNAVLTALEDLRESTGVEVSVLRPLAANGVPELGDDIDAWVRRGLERSPRMAAGQRAVEAEQRAVASARAEHLPKLAMTASKAWSDTDSDSRRNEPYNVASVGVQLNVPIYEGGRVDATVREALARQELAQARLEQTRRELQREVRSAWLKAESGRQRIDATRQSVEAQETAREAQQRGFDLGLVTVVDLLETQHRLYRARSEHARARHDYLKGLVSLHRFAGALGEDDIAMFSALFSGEPRTLR
jgi:outer membrane protein